MNQNALQLEPLPDDLGISLLNACRSGNSKEVMKILAKGGSPNYSLCAENNRNRHAMTPILAAAEYPSIGDGGKRMMLKQSTRIISELIKAGGSIVDIAAPFLDTAAGCGNIEALEIASQQGVDIQRFGFICMLSAIRSADKTMVEYLNTLGIATDVRDRWLMSPFMHVCAGNLSFRRDEKLTSSRKVAWLTEKIGTLINAGLDINARDAMQATPVIRAVHAKNWPVAEALIRSGARTDLKLRNNVGVTHLVAMHGSREFISFYLAAVSPFEELMNMRLRKLQPDIKSIISSYLQNNKATGS